MGVATTSVSINTSVPQGEKRQKTLVYFGTFAFSAAGDTYATGGLAAATNKGFASLGPYGDRTPISVRVWSKTGSGLNYLYDITNSKLKVFGGGSSGNGTVTSTISLAAGNAGTAAFPVVLSAQANNSALTNNNNATPLTGITGVVSTFSGNTVTGDAEIANGTALNATTPTISTDTVSFELIVPSV